uniref:Large ribosomal subunit protein uL30-like ferredoxin-like fold domain-containing protein n=1 Tax=Oryza barthii TaxID=65489 RepID=A0A0D3GG77_9ORYZ
MSLRRCHRTVEHRTTPSLLGMLTQVKCLVVVETQEMYAARGGRPRRTDAPPGPRSSSPTPAAAAGSARRRGALDSRSNFLEPLC